MRTQPNIVDLIAGYDAYATVDELNVHAAVEAPATSPVCVATVAVSKASSAYCASAVASAVGGATYKVGC